MATSASSPHATGFPAEGRCGYYVEKKKRFCRMVVAAGKRFCGEHAGAAEVWYRPTLSRVGNKYPGPVGAGTRPLPSLTGFCLCLSDPPAFTLVNPVLPLPTDYEF